MNSVLLKPLPYAHPEQIVTLSESKPNFSRGSVPYPNFKDWERNNHTFSAMAIARPYGFTLTGTGETERLQARLVTANFFTVFDVNPTVGRAFHEGEDQIGAAPTVMISSSLWQRRFGGDPTVVGKAITLDDRSFTIIGVVPANFMLEASTFPSAGFVRARGAVGTSGADVSRRGTFLSRFRAHEAGHQHRTSARGFAGASRSALASEYPDTNKDTGAVNRAAHRRCAWQRSARCC